MALFFKKVTKPHFMNGGPKGKQKSEKPATGNNEDRFAPERHDHETDESLQEQSIVNEEKQNKIVNEQNDLSSEKDVSQDSKTSLQHKNRDISERIPAMD